MKKARLWARRVVTIYDLILCEGMQGPGMAGKRTRIFGGHVAGRLVAVVCLSLAVAACKGPSVTAPGPGGADAAGSSYQAPPAVTQVVMGPDGSAVLTGSAQPGAKVQFTVIPSRAKLLADADAQGNWRLSLPASTQVRLYGLAATAGERTVQSEGWLAVTPDGHAAQLRAGAGAAMLAPPTTAPHILAIDLDQAGAGVVSGIAKPGAGLAIRIDRLPRGDLKAGPDGRFAFPMAGLGGGSHLIDVAGEGGVAAVQVGAGAPAGVGVFAGQKAAQGWRIDWTTPGGGAQVTVLITNPGAGN